MSEARRGLAYGAAAYGLWGIVPLFWKLLGGIPPVEVLAHRVVWGLLTFIAIAWIAEVGPQIRAALADRKTMGLLALSSILILLNWGVFIAAVVTGHVLDSSLGYFINPLLSVALGTTVLRERLRPLQAFAITSATIGVLVLTVRMGHVPWISLFLASSFAAYGLIRKLARVDSLAGSTVETALVTPIAIGYLAWLAMRGQGQLGHTGASTLLLLFATGAVTAVPLLLFTSAARRLPLSTIGFLQYLSPTGQFLLAIAVFHEPFARDRLIAFCFIWIGLIAFSIDLVRASRRT